MFVKATAHKQSVFADVLYAEICLHPVWLVLKHVWYEIVYVQGTYAVGPQYKDQAVVWYNINFKTVLKCKV